ncbi:MAG TPA: CopG family transcriptional regulator [Chloroflexota bacterium]|nr:CopG family transcriptional regulator [Chloroflexota bacterium]
MRTTIDLEQDIVLATKEIARQRGVSMGRVLSDLARQALSARDAATTRGGVPLFPITSKAGVVTPELVNRLRDEAL